MRTSGSLSSGQAIAGAKAATVEEILLASHSDVANPSQPDPNTSIDITRIVGDVEIVESLNSPGLVLNVPLLDTTGLFELNGLGANDYLYVRFKKDIGNNEIVTRQQWFYVSSIGHYGKDKPDSLALEFVATTINTFLLTQKCPKGVYLGSILEIVEQLLKELFANVPVRPKIMLPDRLEGERVFKFVSNGKSYYNVINDLLERLDVPHFLFETFGEDEPVLVVGPYNSFDRGKVYTEGFYYDYLDAYSQEARTQQSKRILSIASDFNLNVTESLVKGAFSSSASEVDIAQKTYRSRDYHIFNDRPVKLGGSKYFVDNSFNILGLGLTDLKKGLLHSHRNTLLHADTKEGLAEFGLNHNRIETGPLSNASRILMQNSCSHDIAIFGDSSLSVGEVIRLELGSLIDNQSLDKYMSGEYVITSLRHVFENNEMKTYFRCVRSAAERNRATQESKWDGADPGIVKGLSAGSEDEMKAGMLNVEFDDE